MDTSNPRNCGSFVFQSTRAPDALTTFPHFTKSALINAANFSGVPPAASAPCEERRLLKSGDASAALSSLLSPVTIAREVPAAARIPNQLITSYSGTVSAIAGSSGNEGERLGLVTPNPRSLPALT